MTNDDPACCAASRDERPSRDGAEETAIDSEAHVSTVPAADGDDRTKGMARLDGGTFVMGTDSDIGFPGDGEGPAREVRVDPFYIDEHAVTNAEFLEFVRETEYTSDAERFGWSYVFQDYVARPALEDLLSEYAGNDYVEEAVHSSPEMSFD